VTGGVVTKYYYAETQRIAMRQNGDLFFIIGDHLGSTSLVTDSNGAVISEVKYKACPLRLRYGMLREGEIRYSSGTSPTDYTYTGQYSYTDDFGLMFYNARWYDPSLGRFAQADTIVPSGGQGLDRHAYANNNPIRYIDPSGHLSCNRANVAEGDCEDRDTRQILSDEYGITLDELEREFSDAEISAIYAGVRSVGVAFSPQTVGMTGSEAFQKIYGSLIFKRVYSYEYNGKSYYDGACACGGEGAILFTSFYQWDESYSRSWSTTMVMNRNLVVHELGHLYYPAAGNPALDGLSRGALIPGNIWQQHPPTMNADGQDIPGELFADTFVAWVFDAWNTDPRLSVALAVNNAQTAMNNIAQNAMNGSVP